MALPLDEGLPVFTSLTRSGVFTPQYVTEVNGSNLCSACRVFFRCLSYNVVAGARHPEYGDKDLEFAVSPSDIHNYTKLYCKDEQQPPKDGTVQTGFLYIQNPISYHNLSIGNALHDILYHQAHVGQGVARLLPIADYGTNQWNTSSGLAGHFSYVNKPSDNWDTSKFLWATGNEFSGDPKETFELEPLPAGAGVVNECVVNLWAAIRARTDTDMGFAVRLRNAAGAQVGSTAYVVLPTDQRVRFATVKIARVNSAVKYVEVVAIQSTPGTQTNPMYSLFSLEVVAYYTDTTNLQLDTNSISSLPISATSILDFDLVEGSFREAVLDVLAHEPSYSVYLDWKSTLAAGAVLTYADSPIRYSLVPGTNLRSIRKRWIYNERFATRVITRWGVQVNHSYVISTGDGNYESDPVNVNAQRGSRRTTMSLNYSHAYKAHLDKTLDRHFFRNEHAYVEAFMEKYLALYSNGQGNEALEAVCELAACEVEPMDVVEVNYPELGMTARPFVCVGKVLDDDEDVVILTLYDMQNLIVATSPATPTMLEAPAWGGFNSGGMMGVE
jgi:hypothetical protein